MFTDVALLNHTDIIALYLPSSWRIQTTFPGYGPADWHPSLNLLPTSTKYTWSNSSGINSITGNPKRQKVKIKSLLVSEVKIAVQYYILHTYQWTALFLFYCGMLQSTWQLGGSLETRLHGSHILALSPGPPCTQPSVSESLVLAWEQTELLLSMHWVIWFPPLSISSALSSGLPSIYICSKHTSLGNCHSSSTLFPAVVSIDRWHCSFVVAKPINCMCGVCSMWRSKGVYAIGLSQQLAASGEGCSVFLRCEQSMNHISLKFRQA